MKKENILKTIAASLGYFVIYIIVTYVANLCIQLFYYFTYSELRVTDPAAFTQQVKTLMQENNNVTLLLQFGLFFAVMFIFFRVKKINVLTRIRWQPVSKPVYAMVAVLAISNIIAMNFLLDFVFPQSWSQGASDYAATLTSGGLFFNGFMLVLFIPFGEEFLMRGLIAGRLLGRLPSWFVALFTALLFGVGHMGGGMGEMVGTTILGLVFVLVFIWTKSLRASVLAHALNNLLAAYLPWSAIKASMSTPAQLLVGILGFAVAVFVAYMIYRRWNKGTVKEIATA